MDNKPLLFIKTPLEFKDSKNQNHFDSRFEDQKDEINYDLKKIKNVITLNNRGKKIMVRIKTSVGIYEGLPKDIKNNQLKLLTKEEVSIDLNDINYVEIINL